MTTSQIEVCDLSWCGSLYEPSADAHISTLNRLLDRVKPGQIVVLRAFSDCHDYSNSWLSYLRTEALWYELVSRMLDWHKIFSRISRSKSKWFFAANGDVVGSWWELALACHGRVVTNPYAKLGFPDLYIDLFSPLAVLGLKRFKSYDSPAHLRDRAILHAREAFKLRLVSLCLLDQSWIEQEGLEKLGNWFKRYSQIESLNISPKHDYDKLMPTLESVEFQRTDPATRRDWLNRSRIDFSQQMMKEKANAIQARDLVAHISSAAMRFLFSDYQAWLSRRVSRYRLGLHDQWWSKSTDTIVVDVTDGVPPQDVVTGLLVRRKKIIFLSADHRKLKIALENLKSRFDKIAADGREAIQSWDHAVTWVCTADSSRYTGIRCSFHLNDFLALRRGEEVKNYYRISGNFSSANIGWCEALGQTRSVDESMVEHDEIDETISLMSNGILEAKKIPAVGYPLSVGLRLVLLEFILRQLEVIQKYGLLGDFLKLLTSAGWGFASDQFQWDHLLKCHPPKQEVMKCFADLFPEGGNFRTQSVDTVLNYKIQVKAESQSIDIRSSAAATRILALFANKVVWWLLNQGYVNTIEEADLFVTLSWGYPGTLKLPNFLNRDMGQKRIQYWNDQVLNLHS
ncbi:MAG: hypothetical protein NT027_07695, partial [Proteobacteria bacterium]|nr:hypothetical protein [Pseudomonadota bacterium]